MGVITEMLTMKLKAGATRISDPNTEEGKTVSYIKEYMSKQDGVLLSQQSNKLEDKQALVEFTIWKDLAANEKFMSHSGMNEFVERFLTLGSGGGMAENEVVINLFELKDDPIPLLDSPITEILLSYFPADVSDERRAAFDKHVEKFVTEIKPAIAGMSSGVTSGWALKPIDTKMREEGKARVHLSLIQWSSFAAHMKFRETPEFKANVSTYVQEGVPYEMFHAGKEASAL